MVDYYYGQVLTAAHRAHNFQLIAISKRCSLKLAARHDLAIALYRQALAYQLQVLHKLGYGKGCSIKTAGVSIDSELHELILKINT